MWNTNHHLRRPQAFFRSPEGEEAMRPPQSDLRSPGKISRLGEYPRSRWEFSQENREQERNDTRESVFPETDPISLFFRFAYIILVIHRDEYRVTWGQQTRPLSKSGASYKCIQRSYGFYIIFWP